MSKINNNKKTTANSTAVTISKDATKIEMNKTYLSQWDNQKSVAQTQIPSVSQCYGRANERQLIARSPLPLSSPSLFSSLFPLSYSSWMEARYCLSEWPDESKVSPLFSFLSPCFLPSLFSSSPNSLPYLFVFCARGSKAGPMEATLKPTTSILMQYARAKRRKWGKDERVASSLRVSVHASRACSCQRTACLCAWMLYLCERARVALVLNYFVAFSSLKRIQLLVHAMVLKTNKVSTNNIQRHETFHCLHIIASKFHFHSTKFACVTICKVSKASTWWGVDAAGEKQETPQTKVRAWIFDQIFWDFYRQFFLCVCLSHACNAFTIASPIPDFF